MSMTQTAFALRQRKDFYSEVQHMQKIDSQDRVELIIRSCIILACASALYWSTGQLIMLIWAASYLTMLAFYLRLLKLSAPPVYRIQYFTLFGFNVGLQLLFASMSVYVTWLGSPVYWFVGGCGVCGLALHNILRHTTFTRLAVADMIIVIGTVCANLAHFVVIFPGTGGDIAMIVGGLSICAYYVRCFFLTISIRKRLAQSIASEAHAKKMQSVGQLTSGIAHDFNNLLTVIRGNLDLHDAIDNPQERSLMLSEARDATDKAAHLVAQLLAYSRKSPIAPRPIDLTGFMRDFKHMLTRVMPDNIEVEVISPDQDTFVYADPGLLHAALLNVAVNARDAMAHQGGTLTIASATLPAGAGTDAPQDVAEICITDTGPGVPNHVLPRLIEPFYTSKPVGEGSGLGLSMVQGFAEQSGGKLMIENGAGGGLMVCLTVPLSGQKNMA